jgi:hypothetical protein
MLACSSRERVPPSKTRRTGKEETYTAERPKANHGNLFFEQKKKEKMWERKEENKGTNSSG